MNIKHIENVFNFFDDMEKELLKEVLSFRCYNNGDIDVVYKKPNNEFLEFKRFTQEDITCPEEYNDKLEACKTCNHKEFCLNEIGK